MSPLIDKIIQTDKVSIENILPKREGIYTFLNPVSYLDALNHPELFKSFDGIFADGGLLVKAIKVVYGKKIHRWRAVSTCKCTNDCKVKKYFHKSIQMDNENSIFLSDDDLFCL